MDYAVCMVFIVIFGCITAQVMYNKKYFMYKDDGLRGIRALSELMFYMSIVFNVIPFGIVEKLLVAVMTADPDMRMSQVLRATDYAAQLNAALPKTTTTVLLPGK